MKTLTFILALGAASGRDEAALREAFDREVKATEASQRVAAVKKLSGAKEEETLKLLVRTLKDPALEVRKAAALAIEGSSDGAGVAIQALGQILVDKQEDLGLRLACAKALGQARYRGEAFAFLYQTISSIQSEERNFFAFGAEVTGVLDKLIGKSFGANKQTADRWGDWWSDNKAALMKEDQDRREAWKKDKK